MTDVARVKRVLGVVCFESGTYTQARSKGEGGERGLRSERNSQKGAKIKI